MYIEVIPQVEIGNVSRLRVGDVLNRIIAEPQHTRFRFAVAYMRLSGINRLSVSVEVLLNRNGSVSGAVGIDDAITSVEALEKLIEISSDSTVFHTVSGYIYHPKLYLVDGASSAVAIVGSANLTRDGLFRNVEFATAIHLDYSSQIDYVIYNRYNEVLSALLDSSNPNVQGLNDTLIHRLTLANAIQREAQTMEPGPGLQSRRRRPQAPSSDISDLFPPLQVPVAPPTREVTPSTSPPRIMTPPAIVVPPATVGVDSTFIMQLSAFDSSHRTGVQGTPEVLIPHPAVRFFPLISRSGRDYPDAFFDVVLNSPSGRERHNFRIWYYEERATGTRIDEYRLRMNHDTIDLSSVGGGDLLVICRLPPGSDPQYEVTILPRTDPTYPAFFALCTNEAQGKRWGLT